MLFETVGDLDGSGLGAFAVPNKQLTLTISGLDIATADVSCFTHSETRRGQEVNHHPVTGSRDFALTVVKCGPILESASQSFDLQDVKVLDPVNVLDSLGLTLVFWKL